MAGKIPIIPAPPLEPTPPTPETDSPRTDGFTRGNLASPEQDGFDDTFLSPNKENFGFRRPPSPTSSVGNPLSPTYSQPLSPNSPMLPFSPLYQSMSGEPLVAENGKAQTPFNFQPMQLSKSPITKSVYRSSHYSTRPLANNIQRVGKGRVNL